MRLPEEFIVKEVIPYVRSRIIHHLFTELNVSQREIARLLWIKQPTVSKILRSSPKTDESEQYLAQDEIDEFITTAALKILTQEWNPRDFIRAMQAFIWKSLMGGSLCLYHKKLYPELKEIQCDACFRLFDNMQGLGKEREEIRQTLKQCYLRLKDIPEIVDLIPEVRTNIVITGNRASSLEDVAAFPGRITVYKNTLQILDEPEFGASRHLGSLLLRAKNHFPEITCGTCIRNDPLIQNAITKLKVPMMTIPRNRSQNGTLGDVFDHVFIKLKKTKQKTPFFIMDPGTLGLEPVTYIFHHDITKMTDLLITIAKAIHKND